MAEEKNDLLDLIFAAPINLPTVKQTDPPAASDEPCKESRTTESSQDRADENLDSVVKSQRPKEADDKENNTGIEGAKSAATAPDKSSNNEEEYSSRHNEAIQDEPSTVIKGLEQAYEKESDTFEVGEKHNEGDFAEKFDQMSAQSESSEPSERESEKADKIGQLRSPQIDMLMDEMKQRQHFAENAGEEEEAYEKEHYHTEEEAKTRPAQQEHYIEVDVNIDEKEAPESRGDEIKEKLGNRVQGGSDSASESESRKEEEAHETVQDREEVLTFEEKAEAFLEYDRSKALEPIELIEEPSFGISTDSGPEGSEHEPELPKFDEEASLATAAAIMAEFQKVEPPVPRSRTITEGSAANDQDIRFGELSMDRQIENHWEQPEPYYNDNVIMKKNEAYSDHGEELTVVRESTPHQNQEETSQREVPQRQISIKSIDSSIGRTQFGSFEPNAANAIADEVSGALGVSNLKSLFEQVANEKPKLPRGHPPEIQYEYEHDYRVHEALGFAREDDGAAVRTESMNETHVTSQQVIHVEPEEQKSVNELLSMFGGRKQPSQSVILRTQSERVSKSEQPHFVHKPEVERPVNVVPAVRSRTSSASSATSQSAPKEKSRPAKLESSRSHENTDTSSTQKHASPRSPTCGEKDQFQSIRVVKNVRQFVKQWGQNMHTPGSPHPMSPVPANIPDAKERRIIKGIEEQKMKPSPKRRASTVSSIVTNFDAKDKQSNYQLKEPTEKRSETATNKSSDEAVSPHVQHSVSEKDSFNEVMIDGAPVSERRKWFEVQTVQRHSSMGVNPAKSRGSSHLAAAGKRIAEVKAVVRESEHYAEENLKERSWVSTNIATRDEIEKATEEIADYVTQLTPVSQRRKCFETDTETAKKNFIIPAKHIE